MYLINNRSKYNWYISKNKISSSLVSFYVEINVVPTDEKYILKVVNSDTDIKEMLFSFMILEDAIMFSEVVVANCKNFDEVINEYNSYKNDNKQLVKKLYK